MSCVPRLLEGDLESGVTGLWRGGGGAVAGRRSGVIGLWSGKIVSMKANIIQYIVQYTIQYIIQYIMKYIMKYIVQYIIQYVTVSLPGICMVYG